MKTPDYRKEPWKHPAVWGSRVVKMTRDYPDRVTVSVATCECGWAVCARVSGAGHVSQDDAVHGHWLEIVAEAEASKVPA